MAASTTVSTTTIWVQRIFVAAICAFQCNGTTRKQGFPLRDKTRCHPIAKSAATAYKDRGRGGTEAVDTIFGLGRRIERSYVTPVIRRGVRTPISSIAVCEHWPRW